MLRYYVLLRHFQRHYELFDASISSFTSTFVSFPFALLVQIRRFSGARPSNGSQSDLAGADTAYRSTTDLNNSAVKEWQWYFSVLRGFCEKSTSTPSKTVTPLQKGNSLEFSSSTNVDSSGIVKDQLRLGAAKLGLFPLFLGFGNSPLPTSLQWILEEKYKDYSDLLEGTSFELSTVANPISGERSHKFLPCFLYLEPPTGYHMVSPEFANAYLFESEWKTRGQRCQEFCAQYRLQNGLANGSKDGAAWDGRLPVNPFQLLFYWKLEVSATLTYYATFVPYVTGGGSENDKEACLVLPALKRVRQYLNPSFWIPLKLLNYLPFFSTPHTLVEALRNSSLTLSKIPSYGVSPEATEAASVAALSTLNPPRFLSHQNFRYPKGIAELWKCVYSPGLYLSENYYFPCEAYPYLKFCSKINFLSFQLCWEKNFVSNVMHLNKLRTLQGSTMTAQCHEHRRSLHFTEPECSLMERKINYKSDEATPEEMSSTTVNGTSPAPASRSTSFPRLGPYKEQKRKFHLHDSKAVHSWSNTVMCCGELYTKASNIVLACFFDSAISSRHAIPLDESGNVIYNGMNAFRARLIHYEEFPHVNPETRPFESNICSLERFTCASRSDGAGASSDSVWLQRLQDLHPEAGGAGRVHESTIPERLQDARRSTQASPFAFRSPYWAELATVRERWGVDVVPGAMPVLSNHRLYVNAEETTDASRFNPRTCTPKRTHEVFCGGVLLTCAWPRSEALRRAVRDQRGGLPPPALPPRRPPRATEELNEMSNLWVERRVVELARWHLRPGAVHSAISHLEMSSARYSVAPTACSSSSSSSSPSPDDFPSAFGEVVEIVYAEDIVERGELVWLMSYRPTIYYGHISAAAEWDEGFSPWQHDICLLEHAQRKVGVRAVTSPPGVGSEMICSNSKLSTAAVEANVPSKSEHYATYADGLYRRMMRAKRYAQREIFTLSPSSRLELALLSLREGYPAPSREIWATLSFVEADPELKLRRREPMESKPVVIKVDLKLSNPTTQTATISKKTLTLINHTEIDWPNDFKTNCCDETRLFKKV
ncbi:unnamed protein product [Phytomonas sp. EM1]|nr:unnamed protein product [Phytomonas sp. EM1]|eukprot:CCW61659.1 unnamed protein product [Phytomonas sp. isolate EM1]